MFQELEKNICGAIVNIKSDLKEHILDVKNETTNLLVKVTNVEEGLLSMKKNATPGAVNKDTKEEPGDAKDDSRDKKKKHKTRKSGKHKVKWIGSSISKVLDKDKFERDLNVDLTAIKAYCIEEEGRYKDKDFRAIVPEVVKQGNVDTLVLQTGSIEITNIDTNKAAMDPNKDMKEYQREWYVKAEDDSTNLFNIAEEAIAMNQDLNVVIVKRLPRYDRSSKDIMAIKSKLSHFSNHVYDQLWLKNGSPARIHIVELPLGCDNSSHLKKIIYGSHSNPNYDGLHLVGHGAARIFTYRAVQTFLRLFLLGNLKTRADLFIPPKLHEEKPTVITTGTGVTLAALKHRVSLSLHQAVVGGTSMQNTLML